MTEIFKSISQINPEFMWSFFQPKKLSYNLRKGSILNLPRTQSTYFGTNAIHFRGSLIWNNLPAKVKSSNSVFEFKTKIKNLGNIDCASNVIERSCDICKDFLKETFSKMNKFPKKEPFKFCKFCDNEGAVVAVAVHSVAIAVRSFHQSVRLISFLRSKLYYQYSSDDIFSQGHGSERSVIYRQTPNTRTLLSKGTNLQIRNL